MIWKDLGCFNVRGDAMSSDKRQIGAPFQATWFDPERKAGKDLAAVSGVLSLVAKSRFPETETAEGRDSVRMWGLLRGKARRGLRP